MTSFVRERTEYAPLAGAKFVRGDVLNVAHVTAAMTDHDAIRSCVAAQRANLLNPCSPLESPSDFNANIVSCIVSAARASGVRRIGAIAAAGAGDRATALPLVMHVLMARSTIGAMYRDLERMVEAYDASGFDWFAVRPVSLIHAQPSTGTRVLRRSAASPSSRAPMWRSGCPK